MLVRELIELSGVSASFPRTPWGAAYKAHENGRLLNRCNLNRTQSLIGIRMTGSTMAAGRTLIAWNAIPQVRLHSDSHSMKLVFPPRPQEVLISTGLCNSY